MPVPGGRASFDRLNVAADGAALLRVGKVEADDLRRLARRRVVELENCVLRPCSRNYPPVSSDLGANFSSLPASRLEETVAGFEQLNRLPFQLKIEASRRHHAHGRDRMTMQSRSAAPARI